MTNSERRQAHLVAENTLSLIERVAKLFDVSLDIKKQPKSVYFGSYDVTRSLLKAKSYIDTGEPLKAALVLDDFAPLLVECMGRTEPKDLLSDAGAAELLDEAALAIDISRHADACRLLLKADAVEELCGNRELFTEGELRGKVSMFTGVQIDDLFDKDYVRAYRLRDGSAPLPQDLKFRIVKEVQVSPDLDGYIRMAHYLSARTPGQIVFVPFFKVEERLDLSFWAFFIVYEDHVWVATDQKEFHNPENKSSTRRTERVRDSKLENMWLPDVFTMIEKNRSKSREIAAFGGIKKLFSIELMKFHPEERFFLIKLAEKIVRKCLREELDQATTMGLHADQLLLEHKGSVPDKTETLEWWTEDARAHYDDLMATIPATVTKALAPMDYSIVVRSKTYDRNWLGTRQQLEALAHWTVVDQRREEIQKELTSRGADKNKKRDEEEMRRLLEERAQKIVDFAFSARKIGWLSAAVTQFGEEKLAAGDRFITLFSSDYDEKDYEYGWSLGCNFAVGLTGPIDHLFDRKFGRKLKCRSCDVFVRKPIRTIFIRHWSQLAFFLDGRRDLIPPYYRAYRAHNFIPYTGNFILENCHPLTLLRDPCSQDYPNGLTIQVFTCGICGRKLSKGKPERLVLDGDKLAAPESLKGIREAKYQGYGW